MLKFFRKIRYNLISNNKTGLPEQRVRAGRYIKYAIGEIILVMIGILLALQVNNWNERRKDAVKEQELLIQLKEDYQSNLHQLEQKMAMRTSILNSGFKILGYFDHPNSIKLDSLIIYLADISNDPTFDPILNDLIASGNLRLIQNKKLKQLLSNWSSDVVAAQEIEKAWSKLAFEQFQPVVSKLGLSRNMVNSYWNDSKQIWLLDKTDKVNMPVGQSKLTATSLEITNNKELESIVSYAISYSQGGNLQSAALKNRIEEILDLIESEIQNE